MATPSQNQAYLDYAASAPIDPRVREAFLVASEMTGNPSAVHGYGRPLRAAIDAARASVAALLGVKAEDVAFTSGATEANALAIFGSWKLGRILVGPTEHSSVFDNVQLLTSRAPAEVDVLPAEAGGLVNAEAVARALTPKTTLVSVQWVNNVLGTVQPVAAIGAAVRAERERRGPGGPSLTFHCDAVQALGALGVLPAEAGIDLLTLSGHKIGGPKGVGALVRVTRDVTLWPLYSGGGQEHGLRHGTENVAAIVGLGVAAELLRAERAAEAERLARLRDAFEAALKREAPKAVIVGGDGPHVPHIAFVRVPKVPGDRLMLALDVAGFAVSAGSACDAGTRRASRTLVAALGEQAALHGGVRVSFGRGTTEAELVACAKAIGAAAK